MGMNPQKMLQQVQQMQLQMQKAQEELETATVEGSAGGGAVKAVVTGKQVLESLTIDSSAVDPDDVEMLQDLVMSAVNEALKASQAMAEQRMGAITSGVRIPGLF
jgi:DNA-binding YbaB/EbfC family protein